MGDGDGLGDGEYSSDVEIVKAAMIREPRRQGGPQTLVSMNVLDTARSARHALAIAFSAASPTLIREADVPLFKAHIEPTGNVFARRYLREWARSLSAPGALFLIANPTETTSIVRKKCAVDAAATLPYFQQAPNVLKCNATCAIHIPRIGSGRLSVELRDIIPR